MLKNNSIMDVFEASRGPWLNNQPYLVDEQELAYHKKRANFKVYPGR